MEDHLRGLPGIDRAVIYGSWARRYAGEPGPMPHDVDVLVIGTGVVSEVRGAADLASRELGRDVNATVLTPSEWSAGGNGFIAHLKAGPLVELTL